MSGPTEEKAIKFGLPDRWLYCPKTGQVVENLFIPFKAPLCGLYDNQIEARLRFHPEDVFRSPLVKGKKIGLWIDLTKTDRFYFANEVEKNGCKYVKLRMEGFAEAPTREQTAEFIRLVKNFVQQNPGKLVAVHCTHGFNRTGFAICSYLVEVMDWAPDAAVQNFAKDRPCGIYKQDYINELFKRYGDEEDTIEAPEKPQWEYGEDMSLDNTVNGRNGASNGGRNGATNGNGSASLPSTSGKLFMDGRVPGVTVVTDTSLKEILRGKIKHLCLYNRDGFPGLQPVSLERSKERDNLRLLHEHSYLVSWKADGMRYMVYINGEDEVYAFDRDNEIFQIPNLEFPRRKDLSGHVTNTLVDCEMIIDKVNGEDRPRLLIYDIIQFEDIRIAKQNFDIRKSCITRELIEPRQRAFQEGKLDRMSQIMSVKLKDFWEIQSVPKLFEKSFRDNVGHEIDGLIFQPVNQPYTAGRCDTVLKWKPPSHNSVDFKLQIRKIHLTGELPEWRGLLFVQHQDQPFAAMKATRTLQQYDNKIIECSYDVKTHTWTFMRERTDKSLPNSVKTANAVFSTMLFPINQQDLCHFIMKYAKKRAIPNLHNGQPPAKRPATT